MHERICIRKIYTQKLACERSWIARLVRRANMCYRAKCCADRSNCCRHIVIFKLLGCRPPPCWISLDLKFVTDQTVTRAELRHRAKFSSNRLTCARDMAIFQNGAAAILDLWNYKVLTMGRIISVELRHHAKYRGDWSNRCRDISILDFSRWWQPQSWIFNGQEGRTASLCQILSKSLKPWRRCQFSIFQDGGRRHVGFSKF